MRNTIFCCICLLTLFPACQEKSIEQNYLKGFWRLEYMNIQKDNDSTVPFLGGMDGYLLYGESSFMSLHLFPKEYSLYKDKLGNFMENPDSATANHIAKNYNYTGKYWV